MVCIQCYLPPILFMIYMKVFHPFLAPYLEPAIDRVVALIWGPQAVQRGCPIRPKSSSKESEQKTSSGGGDGPSASSSSESTMSKMKDD